LRAYRHRFNRARQQIVRRRIQKVLAPTRWLHLSPIVIEQAQVHQASNGPTYRLTSPNSTGSSPIRQSGRVDGTSSVGTCASPRTLM
jgi:hypothetical protein